jgi:hypothetical protein
MMNVNMAGFPTPNFGGDDIQWMNLSSVGNWNGGMPDILRGATWGSLLQVVKQYSITWDGQFL